MDPESAHGRFVMRRATRVPFAPVLLLAFVAAISACATPALLGGPSSTGGADGLVHVEYRASSADFANPERGFAENVLPPSPAHPPWDSCGAGNNFTAYNDQSLTPALRLNDLLAARAAGHSLVFVRYHLFVFRDAPLSDAFLAQVDHDFATARAAGVKIVPRFAYNFGTGGPDAPLERVLGHLDQLAPVLQRNVDVLAYMELGFIGCWGEGHQSSNNLAVDEQGINFATRAILDKGFAVVPTERMIAVRSPLWKFQYFDGSGPIPPLTEDQAYTGSMQARWGAGDDCLTCGEYNSGTWSLTPVPVWSNAPVVRSFLHDDNLFVVQEGEPGVPGTPQPFDADEDGYTSNYDACARVLDIFENEHWSAIDGYTAVAAQRWQHDGCYQTIATHLGYRFRLVSSTLPTRLHRGNPLRVQLTIHNDGWAAPYNPRSVELVLRNQTTGALTRLPVSADPRHWLPGTTESLSFEPIVPPTLKPGRYDLLLALPDPAPSLHDRPEYAIRLANEGAWDSACGCNALGESVFVTGGNPNSAPR
jgi:hypothetical protein